MKSTPTHRDAYADALVKGARDAFYTLHPVVREYRAKLPEGTAAYRLEIVHRGNVTVGRTVTRSVGPIANLLDHGRMIQRNAGVEVEWSYPVDQDGIIHYRLLEWQEKPARYKELLSWQNPQKNTSKFIATKVFLMNSPPPAGTALANGEKIVIASQPPALPMTAAELATAQKSAVELILPVGTRREIQTALCNCTLIKASTSERNITGTVVGANNDAVQVRVVNKSPWAISEIQLQVEFVSRGRRFRAVLESANIDPGKSQTLELSRPLGTGAFRLTTERNAAPPAPTIEVSVIKFAG